MITILSVLLMNRKALVVEDFPMIFKFDANFRPHLTKKNLRIVKMTFFTEDTNFDLK